MIFEVSKRAAKAVLSRPGYGGYLEDGRSLVEVSEVIQRETHMDDVVAFLKDCTSLKFTREMERRAGNILYHIKGVTK